MKNDRMFTIIFVLGGLYVASSAAVSQEEVSEALPVPKNRPMLVHQEQTPLDGLIPVTTKSGLTYYDLKMGQGKPATPFSKVSINYVCWLPDGTTFDSNAKLRKPATLRLHKPEIIAAWKEGIGSMREGGIRRLDVPWQLGYGESGKYPVGPKQDLIFEIQLVKVHEEDDPRSGEINPLLPFSASRVPAPASVEGLTSSTTATGLTIWNLAPGEGGSPKEASRVLIDYSCWLKDKTPVESTRAQGQRESTDIRLLPPGMQEVLQQMKVGGRAKVEIPAKLAYGEKGKTPRIPPHADLICDIDLHAIEVEDMVEAERAANTGQPRLLTAPPGLTMTQTESGLKYWDLKVGDGPTPSPDSQVTIQYQGWLTDGRLFDSSEFHGGAATFPLKASLKGWVEGISTMKVGGKRRLEVPPSLGYGAAERGSPVPPNSTLIFEIDLVEVK